MKREMDQFTPKARQDGLIVQQLADEVLVYDEQRHKAHCLNQTAAIVWQQCDGKRKVSDIAKRASVEMGAAVGEEMVWLAVEELGKRRLLTERQSLGTAGASRREMMKRLGIGAAIALPLVTTIVAPEAAQAANCIANGQPCTIAAQCCSQNLCSGGICS